jgi:peptidyl-prolyl cis-trans isomerase D
MIHIFRKEMKRWYVVLWFVIAAFILSSLAAIFFRRPQIGEMSVATVNGRSISLKEYRQALAQVHAQIELYRNYARAYGISAEMFINLAGLNNPEKVAFDTCVRNEIVDKQKDEFDIHISDNFFSKELLKRLPMQLKNDIGGIKEDVYAMYVSRQGSTIAEFEERMEEDFKRELFQECIKVGYYVPTACVEETLFNDHTKKQFEIVKFPFEHFLQEAKKQSADESILKRYFQKHKENYRIPEKRKARFWVVSAKEYAKKMTVSDEMIEAFYEKNKGTLFRIPPKVKVRRLLIKAKPGEAPEKIEQALFKIKELHKQVKEKPEEFERLVKEHSDDTATVAKGGIIDFFDKGTYDPEFEKAAFRLMNKSEISDIVKTDEGYEMLQLVERVPASEKSLECVKGEIVETIKAKRSLLLLKNELQTLLHDVKSDKQAADRFIKIHNLKEEYTDWVTKKDAQGDEPKNLVAEKIFDKSMNAHQYGYLVHEDDYILCHLIETQKSFIPEYKTVEKEVASDYYTDVARGKLKTAAKTAKRELLQKKVTLKALAEKYSFKREKTGMIPHDDKLELFDLGKSFVKEAFIMNDPENQVMKYKKDSDYYFAQLLQAEKIDLTLLHEERAKIIANDKYQRKPLYLEAFIASLFRNATIKKQAEMFDQNPQI